MARIGVTGCVVLLLGVLPGLTPKAEAVPVLEWTKTFSRKTGGEERYRASTTFGSNTYVIYQDDFFETRLVKFNATGSVLMDVPLDVMDAFITAMTVDSAGNIVAAGMVDLVTFPSDLWVAKYDSAGNSVWPSPMVYDSGFDDHTYGVATDTSGNVIIAGTFQKFPDTGSIVVKYGPSGGPPLWAETIDTVDDDNWYDVTTDGADNVYLAGSSDFGGLLRPFLTKYDSSGVQQYDVDYPFLFAEARAAAYAVGNDSVYLATDDILNVTVLQVDAPAGALTTSGIYSSTAFNIVGSIAVDASGTVFVAGWTSSPDFDIRIIQFSRTLAVGWTDTYDAGGFDGLSFDFVSEFGLFYAAVHVGVSGASAVQVAGSVLTSDCIGTQDLFVREYDKDGPIQWTQVYDKSSFVDVIGTVVDVGGDIYVGGAIEFDPVLLKYNSKGNLKWAKYPTFGSLCGLDAEGLATFGDIIYLAASAFDPVSGINRVQVVEFDPGGTQMGALNFGLIPDSYPGPITVDDAGNLYLAGWFASTTTFQNELFVTKFDSLGTIQWTTTMSLAVDDNPAGIALDGAGDLYVLESTPADGVTNNQFVLAKFSRTSGGVLWTRTYTASPTLTSEGWGLTASGTNVYLAGLERDPVTDASWGRIYKLDTSGNVVWTKNYNGGQDASFLRISVDVFDNVFVTGGFGTAPITSDILTLSYDPGGTVRWSLAPFDSGGPDDVGTGLAMGSLYVAGNAGREALLLKYTEPATFIVSLSASPVTVMQGQDVTVVLKVGNTGGIRAWTVAPSGAAGPAPPGMVALASGPSPASTPWLDPGDSASFTWTYKAVGIGYVDFTATVTGTDSASNNPLSSMALSSTVFIMPAAVLSATAWIVQTAPSLIAGSTFELMFSVSNTGGVDASAVLASLTLSDPSLVRIDSGPVPSGTVVIAANSVTTFVWKLTVVSWDGGPLTLNVSVSGIDLLNSMGVSATAQVVLNTKPKPAGEFVAYPSPIEGPPWRLNIYLRLNDDAREVTVDAYDAAIHRVYSGKWGFVAQVDGALEVDGIDKWAPGIYLLRARAVLVNGSTQKFPVVKVVVK